MSQREKCTGCGGTGLTEKIDYEITTDEKGEQTTITHRYLSQCSGCGGTGEVG